MSKVITRVITPCFGLRCGEYWPRRGIPHSIIRVGVGWVTGNGWGSGWVYLEGNWRTSVVKDARWASHPDVLAEIKRWTKLDNQAREEILSAKANERYSLDHVYTTEVWMCDPEFRRLQYSIGFRYNGERTAICAYRGDNDVPQYVFKLGESLNEQDWDEFVSLARLFQLEYDYDYYDD